MIKVMSHDPSTTVEQHNAAMQSNHTTCEKVKEHKCVTCGKLFSRKFTLQRHIKLKHPDVWSGMPAQTGQCICQYCGFKCHWKKHLSMDHLIKEHGVIYIGEKLQFENRTGVNMLFIWDVLINKLQGPVVRKLDSAIHQIVIFSSFLKLSVLSV